MRLVKAAKASPHAKFYNLSLGKPKPQITWNDVIQIFPKRKFLWDKDIVRWKIDKVRSPQPFGDFL